MLNSAAYNIRLHQKACTVPKNLNLVFLVRLLVPSSPTLRSGQKNLLSFH